MDEEETIDICGTKVRVVSKRELEGMAADQPVIVVCVPVGWSSNPMQGSEKVPCSCCGNELWMSPSTKISIPENSRILCVRCATEVVLKERRK